MELLPLILARLPPAPHESTVVPETKMAWLLLMPSHWLGHTMYVIIAATTIICRWSTHLLVPPVTFLVFWLIKIKYASSHNSWHAYDQCDILYGRIMDRSHTTNNNSSLLHSSLWKQGRTKHLEGEDLRNIYIHICSLYMYIYSVLIELWHSSTHQHLGINPVKYILVYIYAVLMVQGTPALGELGVKKSRLFSFSFRFRKKSRLRKYAQLPPAH